MILTLIKTLWKYYWVLQLLVIITLVYFFRKEKAKANDYESVYQASQREIRIWRDEAGKNRSRAEIAEIDAANAKLVLESNLKETIRKEVGNLRKNLISYSQVSATTRGTISGSLTDTLFIMNEMPELPAKTISIRELNLDFQAVYVPSLDTLMASYQVKHNFEVFYYYRKPGKKPFNFLRRKQAVAEIKFDNSGSRADSLFTIVMKRKKSIFNRLFSR